MIFTKSAILATVLIFATGLGGCGYENTADIGPGQVIPRGDGTLIGRIKVEVIKEPRAFEGHAELLYWTRNGWEVIDKKIYRKHNLPPVGKDEWVKPFLESYCFKGRWRMQMHFYGITQDGTTVKPTWAYWPGPGKKAYFKIRKCD